MDSFELAYSFGGKPVNSFQLARLSSRAHSLGSEEVTGDFKSSQNSMTNTARLIFLR